MKAKITVTEQELRDNLAKYGPTFDRDYNLLCEHYEDNGLSRSDAQGVVDAFLMSIAKEKK